jgi:Lar family restriction alleviation protein
MIDLSAQAGCRDCGAGPGAEHRHGCQAIASAIRAQAHGHAVSAEPLPCPFCGQIDRVVAYDCYTHGQPVRVWCWRCESCGPERRTKAEAIAAWNARPTPPAAAPTAASASPVGAARSPRE